MFRLPLMIGKKTMITVFAARQKFIMHNHTTWHKSTSKTVQKKKNPDLEMYQYCVNF